MSHRNPSLIFVLPLVQMTLGVFLIERSQAWFQSLTGVQELPGPAPAYVLLLAINAPVALLRPIWFYFLPESWDAPMLIGAIGFLWCWVALNIRNWRRIKAVLNFGGIPQRVLGNMLLISVGLIWGTIAFKEIAAGAVIDSGPSLYGPNLSWTRWTLFVLIVGLHATWSIVLGWFFGRDLMRCVVQDER